MTKSSVAWTSIAIAAAALNLAVGTGCFLFGPSGGGGTPSYLEVEPDDAEGQATAIADQSKFEGTCGAGDPADFYDAFMIDPPGWVAKLAWDGSRPLGLHVYLPGTGYDQTVSAAPGESTLTLSTTLALAAGSYDAFVVVVCGTGASVDYHGSFDGNG